MQNLYNYENCVIKQINDNVLYLYAYHALINEGINKTELLHNKPLTKTLAGGYYFKYKYK
jgi:hypothetical protein